MIWSGEHPIAAGQYPSAQTRKWPFGNRTRDYHLYYTEKVRPGFARTFVLPLSEYTNR
jgi:hypothetical protein